MLGIACKQCGREDQKEFRPVVRRHGKRSDFDSRRNARDVHHRLERKAFSSS
jgi:hypothetical protein